MDTSINVEHGKDYVVLTAVPSNINYTYDWSWVSENAKTLPILKKDDLIPYVATIDPSKAPYGKYTVTVEIRDENGHVIGTPEGNFPNLIPVECHVVHSKSLIFTEGDVVALEAHTPPNIGKFACIVNGERESLTLKDLLKKETVHYEWIVANDNINIEPTNPSKANWNTSGLTPENYHATFRVYESAELIGECQSEEVAVKARQIQKGDVLPVAMQRTSSPPTGDQALWAAIRNRMKAVSFERYGDVIDRIFCGNDSVSQIRDAVSKEFKGKGKNFDQDLVDTRLSINSVDSYNVLKLATEIFLLLECGVVKVEKGRVKILDDTLFDNMEESGRFNEAVTVSDIETRLTRYFGGKNTLPYLNRILEALMGKDLEIQEKKLPYCDGVLKNRFNCPSLIELIWSYWHEEGGLAQTMNAIALRFQNRRGPSNRDPLAQLEIDPLRPLNNLLWGYIQNEYNRLNMQRRAYEYDHHYGFSINGRAVPTLRTADSRSKFLEGFHNLLYKTSVFYKEDADTTVVADAFPLLQTLREVHIVLAEGAHNQFGDLPWTARVEMMVEQWMLARPEMQDFLRGRPMVPYKEPWMGRVDAMKKLQGWTDTSITHFQELASFGEQIILSVRYGDWIDVNDENQAKNWARYWKPEIQGYIHAYRAATGVDLTTEPVDATPPWAHLKRIEAQKRPVGV